MRACKSMYYNILGRIEKYFLSVILAQKRESVAAIKINGLTANVSAKA